MNLDYLIRKTFCSYFFHRILFHVYIPMYQVKGLKINTIFHYIDIFIIFMLFTYFTYLFIRKSIVGGRFRREVMYIYLWLIHVAVWQKPIQHCKAIILQLKGFPGCAVDKNSPAMQDTWVRSPLWEDPT